jgi:type IV pilus assembly protein PilN
MIRINLLGVERQKSKKSTPAFDASQRATLACVLVFALTAVGIGGWFWSLDRAAAQVRAETAAAQAEMARLQTVMAEVKRAEDRRSQLQERVKIIEELRRGQGVPVQLLDHVSRSLPDMLWLTTLEQKADAVNIEGKTTTLISLADFVGNLGTNALVRKPIDIVNSEVEAAPSDTKQGVDLIKFVVKAPLAQPPTAGTGTAAAPGAGAAAPGAR